jgi:hypothetical protein
MWAPSERVNMRKASSLRPTIGATQCCGEPSLCQNERSLAAHDSMGLVSEVVR